MSAIDTAPPSFSESPVKAIAPPRDWLGELVLLIPILGCTFIEKFAVPMGSQSISFGLPAIGGAVGVGLLFGRMRFIPTNLMYFCMLMAVFTAMQIFGGNPFSWQSLALLAVMHAPYATGLKVGTARPDIQLKFFQTVMVIIAACGIAQFGLQFVVSHKLAYPLDSLGTKWVVQNFNEEIPLSPGGSSYKSNGVFLAEPSEFSQDLAIAVIIELLLYRRILFLMLFFGGMVVAYSGSGIVILGCLLPPIIIKYRRPELFFVIVIGALVAYFGADALDLQLFVKRASEFSSPDSSGFGRYVGGWYLFGQFLLQNGATALFGLGAGAIKPYALIALYPVSPVTWVKIPFEYGIGGAVLYFAFVGYCMFKPKQLGLFKLAMLVHLLINTPLVPFVQGLNFSMLVWPPPEEDKTGAANIRRARRLAVPFTRPKLALGAEPPP